MEGWKFWWGVAAFFLGGLATQLNGWLTYRRQRRDRAEDAEDALRQRREEFELQHLLTVNDLLRDYREKLFDFSRPAEAYARQTAGERDADDVAALGLAHDALLAAEVAVHGRIGFILSDPVRAAVERAVDCIDRAPTVLLEGEPFDWGELAAVMVEAYDLIAARVRDLYAGRAGS